MSLNDRCHETNLWALTNCPTICCECCRYSPPPSPRQPPPSRLPLPPPPHRLPPLSSGDILRARMASEKSTPPLPLPLWWIAPLPPPLAPGLRHPPPHVVNRSSHNAPWNAPKRSQLFMAMSIVCFGVSFVMLWVSRRVGPSTGTETGTAAGTARTSEPTRQGSSPPTNEKSGKGRTKSLKKPNKTFQSRKTKFEKLSGPHEQEVPHECGCEGRAGCSDSAAGEQGVVTGCKSDAYEWL